MRTGTDATRTGKTRKKAAKMPASKSAKKSVSRPSSDVIQPAVMEDQTQVVQDATAELHPTDTVISGLFS